MKLNDNLSYSIKEDNDTVVVYLNGHLDVSLSNILNNELEKKQDLFDNFKIVVFDIKDLEYISSAGLRLFAHQQKLLQIKDIKFEIHNPSDYIRKVFDMTGFWGAFKILNK